MSPHALHLRIARSYDAEALQSYFRHLSKSSRSNRFLGGIGDVSLDTVMRSIGCAGSDLFSIIAVSDDADVSRVIGEVVCGITPDAEVALSVEDASQGDGIGRALLMAVEVQAVQYGVRNMFGHIWSTNNAIRNLAATLGYVVDRTGGSWDSCILRKSLSVVAPRGKIICRTAKLTLAPELASSDGQALQALADQ